MLAVGQVVSQCLIARKNHQPCYFLSFSSVSSTYCTIFSFSNKIILFLLKDSVLKIHLSNKVKCWYFQCLLFFWIIRKSCITLVLLPVQIEQFQNKFQSQPQQATHYIIPHSEFLSFVTSTNRTVPKFCRLILIVLHSQPVCLTLPSFDQP